MELKELHNPALLLEILVGSLKNENFETELLLGAIRLYSAKLSETY